MSSPQLAATLGNTTTHSDAMPGLLIGAVGGAVLIGLAVLTGGASVILLGIAAGAGTALGGEYVGAAMVTPTGVIATGSMNVFVGGLPAARAVLDLSAGCEIMPAPHPPLPIATGAATVFINGVPAARHGDKLPCGGVIQAVNAHVFFGGATVTLIPVSPEVPPWVNRFLEVTMVTALVLGVGALAMEAAAAEVSLSGALLTGLGVGVRVTASVALADRLARDAGIVARHEGATEAQARVAEQLAALLASHGMNEVMPGEMGAQPRAGGRSPYPGWNLPRQGGAWDGPEGNSTWYPGATEGPDFRAVRDADGNVIQDPNHPVVQVIGARGVEYTNGQINFDPYSLADVPIEMRGTDGDGRRADTALAQALGPSWTPAEVRAVRVANRLTWHHSVDGSTMQLVPTVLNGIVSHTGGAAEARNAGSP